MHEFRSGSLGRITLETPEEFAQWLAAGELLDARARREEGGQGGRRKGKRPDPVR